MRLSIQTMLLDEREADGDAGAGIDPERLALAVAVEDPLRLAEADDHRLLGLGHDGDRAADQDQQQDGEEDQGDRVAKIRSSRPGLLRCGWAAAGAGPRAAEDRGDAGRLDDGGVDLRQDPLHRLVIHAPAGHVRRLPILGKTFSKAAASPCALAVICSA